MTTTILTVLAVLLVLKLVKIAWNSVTVLSKRNRWR